MHIKGKHEIYCCDARVRISERGVEVLTEPLIDYCPLHEALYGTSRIDTETVRKSVENKIVEHGFCCKTRTFNAEPIVAYGASEMMSVWLEKGLVDCAVIVCEGAGTVITTNSKLVQGIGARLTGIISTSPIQKTFEHVKANKGIILNETHARIDQVEGAKRAFDFGFKRVAVSVAGFQAKAISEIRDFAENAKADVLIFSVCNTCVHRTQLKCIVEADIVCAGASKLLRTEIGTSALMQLGVTIPVYILTDKGKRLVLDYLATTNYKLVAFRTNKMPYQV